MTNWKTTITGIGEAITSLLTLVAALPAQLGELSTIIPEPYKPKIVAIGLIATALLRVVKSMNTQDSAPAVPSPTVQPPPIKL